MTTTRLYDDAAQLTDALSDELDDTKTAIVSDAVRQYARNTDALDDTLVDGILNDTDAAVTDGGIDDWNDHFHSNWDPKPVSPDAIDDWEAELRETWRIRCPAALAICRYEIENNVLSNDEDTYDILPMIEADQMQEVFETHFNLCESSIDNYLYRYPMHKDVPEDGLWTPTLGRKEPTEAILRRILEVKNLSDGGSVSATAAKKGLDPLLESTMQESDGLRLTSLDERDQYTVDHIESLLKAVTGELRYDRKASAVYLQWYATQAFEDGIITGESRSECLRVVRDCLGVPSLERYW